MLRAIDPLLDRSRHGSERHKGGGRKGEREERSEEVREGKKEREGEDGRRDGKRNGKGEKLKKSGGWREREKDGSMAIIKFRFLGSDCF